MIWDGVIEAIGEVRGDGGRRNWMLGIGLIAVEDVGWTDRGGGWFGSLLMWCLGVEVTIHYQCGK